MALPSGEQLRFLEKQSRKIGSKIPNAAVPGIWKLEHVWGKNNQEPTSSNGAILRSLKATLQIKESEEHNLELINSVELLGIRLSFCGPGRLVQRRPLLFFHFHHLHLDVAGRRLLSIPLPVPSSAREPFFALIAKDQTDTGVVWMAARGRGGGLALWVRDHTFER